MNGLVYISTSSVSNHKQSDILCSMLDYSEDMFYDLTIQCDASGKGLGSCLLQNGRPIAYHSRALTDAETRYASIEKEMLAVVDAFESFHQYTFGRFTQVISDHKPLKMIVKKPLRKAPKRLQGMLLHLQQYGTTTT